MFKTDRTVFRSREGVLDLIDEKNMNIVSGYVPFRNKTEKLNAWKKLKQEYGDNIQVNFKEKIIEYTCQVDRTLFL